MAPETLWASCEYKVESLWFGRSSNVRSIGDVTSKCKPPSLPRVAGHFPRAVRVVSANVRWLLRGGGMHCVARVAAWLAVAIGVAGCNALEGQYLRQGIGTDLGSMDVATATELQNVYLDHLCRQTLPFVGAGVPSCSQEQVPPNAWPLIVQAGMNDIDQRCDAYLAWLDQKKRQNSAILAEISAIRSATDAILNPTITHGVGPRTLAAVAAAFGLATDTFNNVNSLLLQVDHTTVQAVVFGRRKD